MTDPDDAYEFEAERAAETVTRTPDSPRLGEKDVEPKRVPTVVQRLCGECDERPDSTIEARKAQARALVHPQPRAELDEGELAGRMLSDFDRVTLLLLARRLRAASPEALNISARWCARKIDEPDEDETKSIVSPEPEPEAPQTEAPAFDARRGLVGLGAGFPLPPDLRARMQPIVGNDLSGVRLHTNAAAARLAAQHRSLALSAGDAIAFGEGQYRPGTVFGDGLLAHELAHARQQQLGPGAASGAWLESQANHAGYVAALRLLDPSSVPQLGTPAITGGRGVSLQRCMAPEHGTPFDWDEIRELSSREEYVRRGELAPRGLEGITPVGEGPFLGPQLRLGDLDLGTSPEPALGTSPAAAAGGTPRVGPSPLPNDLGAGAKEMSMAQMQARLARMEITTKAVAATATDLEELAPLGTSNMVAIRLMITSSSLESPDRLSLEWPSFIPAKYIQPDDPAALSREIIRSEHVLDRSRDALSALLEARQREYRAGQMLPEYDLDVVQTEIDHVRREYMDALVHLLTPNAVELFNKADRDHAELSGKLLQHKLQYFRTRDSSSPEIQDSIEQIQEWALWLQERLDALQRDVPKLREARESGSDELPVLERRFVQHGRLIQASIEALGEWDLAVQAFDYLADNSALWNFAGVYAIAMRLGQMREAAYSGDTAYLELLVRDHQRDEKVREYYKSLPGTVQWSQFVILLGITLVSLCAAAGVGVVVGAGATAGLTSLGLAADSWIVLGASFVAQVGAEALVFTIVSRQLQSMFPGMEPASPFWVDLLWTFFLFATMRLALPRVGSQLLAAGYSSAARAGGMLASAYGILQAYGYLRFVVTEKRLPTWEQFGEMSLQNAIMLLAIVVALRPISPLLGRLQGRFELARFRRVYGPRFEEVRSGRSRLVVEAAERMKENPNATEKEIADLRSRCEELDLKLRELVDEAANDPELDFEALREETYSLFEQIESRSVAELLTDTGLDPSLEPAPSGAEGVWMIPAGRANAFVAFLRTQGYEITAEHTVSNGRAAIEASVPGKGRVLFVERSLGELSKTEVLARRHAGRLIEIARFRMDAIRTVVEEVAAETGARTRGSDAAVKGVERLSEKIADRVKEQDVKRHGLPKAVERQAARIDDVLRFALEFPREGYHAGYEAVKAQFVARGFELVREYNAWKFIGTPRETGYRGINLFFRSPEGQLFEVQIHTPESFANARLTHPYYEIERSKSSMEEQGKAAREKALELSKSVPIPEGVME